MDTGLAKIQSLLQQVQVLVSKEKAIQHENTDEVNHLISSKYAASIIMR